MVREETDITKRRRAQSAHLRSLTPQRVAQMRKEWEGGLSITALAERYCVSVITARTALKGTGSYRGV